MLVRTKNFVTSGQATYKQSKINAVHISFSLEVAPKNCPKVSDQFEFKKFVKLVAKVQKWCNTTGRKH